MNSAWGESYTAVVKEGDYDFIETLQFYNTVLRNEAKTIEPRTLLQIPLPSERTVTNK